MPIKVENAIEINSVVTPRITVYNKKLSVNWVSNPIIDGKGICWASCVAAKVNYQNETQLTARDVYDSLNHEYDGKPVGNDLWIERAYSLYDVSITMVDNSVSAGACLTQLISEKPIHIGILGVGENGADAAHSVLIIGVNYADVSGAQEYIH